MAEIRFAPTCGKCGAVLLAYVDCSKWILRLDGWGRAEYRITPSQCEHCGALFDRIVMPIDLPLDNSAMPAGGGEDE